MQAPHPNPGVAANTRRAQQYAHVSAVTGLLAGGAFFASFSGAAALGVAAAIVGGRVGGGDWSYGFTAEAVGAGVGFVVGTLVSRTLSAVGGSPSDHIVFTATLVGRLVFGVVMGQRTPTAEVLVNNPR